jgi:colanic acid/amylovoran biosynthesis glycosyltransferase
MSEPRRLRVAVMRHTLYLRSEQFIPTQARALEDDVVLVARDPIIHDPGDLRSVSLFRSRAAKVAYMLGDRRALTRFLDREGIDVLHAHFGVEGELTARAAAAAGISHFTTLHGFDISLTTSSLLKSGTPAWVRYGLRRAAFLSSTSSHFVCVSEDVQRRAVALGAAPERTTVIYNGVDVERLDASDPPTDPVILHVARLVEKKGTQDLLAALPSVIAQVPRVRLRIVGDGPLRPSLEMAARSLGVADHVDFLGAQPSDDVIREMRAATVLCSPSVTSSRGDQEGLPQVILEASALGRATVATVHGGIPEAVVDGGTGYLVGEHRVADLAAALVRVVSNRDHATTLGRAAASLAREKFDVRIAAKRLSALYRAAM